MTSFFITSTGTAQGKTLVTAALIHQFQCLGQSVCAIKPVLSGYDDFQPQESDAGMLLQAMGDDVTPETLNKISPWRFTAPLSPDAAAKRENTTLSFAAVRDWCRQQQRTSKDIFLVEGAGGVRSPLAEGATNQDLIEALNLPVILVAGSYLGAISHILTALECLERRGRPVKMLVLNEGVQNALPADVLMESLGSFLPADMPVRILKPLAPGPKMWEAAPDFISGL